MRLTAAVSISIFIVAGSAAAQSSGQKIFQGKGMCYACHGSNARGTPLAPDLTDTLWLNIDGSLQSITTLVRTGVSKPVRYPGAMPAMGGAKLSDEEIAAVAAHIKSLGTGAADTAHTAHEAATNGRGAGPMRAHCHAKPDSTRARHGPHARHAPACRNAAGRSP
jgi:mono/diheme cytochrome c family protein